jgi:molybdopterin converting factor small subunit
VERDQASRVSEVVRSLDSLRNKLQQQEDTKKAAVARAQQLAAVVQELRKRVASQQEMIQERDGELRACHKDHSEVCGQLNLRQTDLAAVRAK